ncbi:hypothetical protein, partial [Xanthomonas citri]|uniref:hypothetical protein n=1 Tax=Xanthomonas citri TaxID=346 RepID=UPI001F3ED90B
MPGTSAAALQAPRCVRERCLAASGRNLLAALRTLAVPPFLVRTGTMPLTTKLPKVGTTIFTVMSQLAAEHGAG